MHDYIFSCVIELKWKLASCIPYALGHPRTIGVSACGNSLENNFGGLTK